MNKLEKELRKASGSPKMTAVKFAKINQVKLCQNYGVSRQALRQQAELVDKQTSIGFIPTPSKKVVEAVAKNQEVVAVPIKITKVEEAPKAKPKPKSKLKALKKTATKKKSKRKS